MKKYLFVLSLFILSPAWAQKVWLQTPAAAIPSGDISYSEFLYEKFSRVPLDPQILSWSQMALEQEKIGPAFFQQLEEIESNQVIGESTREMIVDLMTKLVDRATPAQRNELQRLSCKWVSLDHRLREKSSLSCKAAIVSLSSLKEKFPNLSAVILEDILLTAPNWKTVPLEEGAAYNWKLLSDSQKMISFRGTYQNLISQYFTFQNLVDGTCESFTHQVDDLELLSRGMVYFSPECQRSLAKPETSNAKDWYEKNRPWIIPAAIVVLGAVAYQFKDKKIIIDKPSFK